MNEVLNIKERENKNAKALRKEGIIPIIFYGPEYEATSAQADAIEFEKVFRKAGTSSIILLKGFDDDKEALIKDIQLDPITNKPIHADLYIIKRGQKVSVSVPIEFVGESKAEKVGLMVVKQMHELDIFVRPSEIPQQIEVDITNLENEGDAVYVKDLPLPASAEIEEMEDDEIVAIVVAAQKEEEQEQESIDMESIEVEQKGKKEGEEDKE